MLKLALFFGAGIVSDTLSVEQEQHSTRAVTALREHIQSAGGSIAFADFMQFALYEPGLGYYVSGNHKLGAGGDFTTAPLISPLFSACLGNHCASILKNQGKGEILELGAGTGDMAIGILGRLAALDCLPERYAILEVSPELQQRQQHHLKNRLPAEINARVQWLDQLPTDNSFCGVILANEVMDAMPVERIRWQQGRWEQQIIRLHENSFNEDYQPITSTALQAAADKLPTHLTDGYLTEVNTWIEPWIKSLSQCLKTGVVTLIDYGFLREEYYHPQRHMGTLMCHFQQQAHDNPLLHIGLQDITAHVDFSCVGESAEACGLEVTEYCNQTHFLIDCGITDLLSEVTDRDDYEKLLPGIKQLTQPQEMGELFKVMSLTRFCE
jgi:SAM-dependent MidA family methyltransferase